MNIFNNRFKDARVIVTGHTGFKGSWLSFWLSELGAEVLGISIDIPTKPSHFQSINLGNSVKDLKCDIRDKNILAKIIKDYKPDFIFHLAAQPIVGKSYYLPSETFETNTFGTINILEALKDLNNKCTAIMITSDKCYENQEWTFGYRENDILGGKDPYSASKAAAEIAIKSYFHTFFKKDCPIKLGVTRAGNVIGGGDWADGRIVPDCIKAWSKGELVKIRNPNSTRPWQHVLEPLSGYLLLADKLAFDSDLSGHAFNFGPASSQNYSVGEVVSFMSNLWPNSKWDLEKPKLDCFQESGLLKLNCDKALHLLDWKPVMSYEETIIETISWYKNFYLKKELTPIEYSLKQIKDYIGKAQGKELKWSTT